MSVKRFILADRDGTLIEEKHYLSDPDQVVLIPGCGHALSQANQMGWEIVCLSNQSGVGRGYFGISDVEAVNKRVQELLKKDGATINTFYFCPDHPDIPSHRRKPAPGMAEEAAQEFGFDLSQSVVVGDKDVDIQLAKAIGAVSVLVRTGYGRKHEEAKDCEPDYIIESIASLPAILQNLT